jgi:glycosyltransferase involved in cell wall biosynthesis
VVVVDTSPGRARGLVTQDPLELLLSVVIPLKNEALNVPALYEELTGVLVAAAIPYELILIDDGSTDETFDRLVRVQRGDPRVRVIRFDRTYGQTAGFAAGFAHARGRFVATMDGDLQNDPADLPRLLALASSHDIVCGWRRDRHDAWLTRRVPSAVANWLLGLASGTRLHDNGCSLKVFRREVVTPLRLRPGMHRYLPALARQLGDRVVEVVVTHRPRRYGTSKYGLSRTFRVVIDLFQLRRLMRSAIDPAGPDVALYRVAQLLERAPDDAATDPLPQQAHGATADRER